MSTEPGLIAVTIFCSNVPRALAFYESLGVTFDDDLHGSVGPVVIGLHPASDRWPTTQTALSLTVADLGLVTAALDGIGTAWEHAEGMNGKVVGTHDPDGNRVLIAEPIDT